MLNPTSWYVLDVNPEPWAVGPLSVARSGKGVYPKMGRNQQLYAYQQALRSTLLLQYPNLREFVDSELGLWGNREVKLCFYFWQKQETAETVSAAGRTRRTTSKVADCTNMVKAAEDAVAGILFANDIQVREQVNVIVDRGAQLPEGIVVISIEPWAGFDPACLPEFVWDRIDVINGVEPRQGAIFDA
jgi:Holliday junction resolvase RusA-like endonuclease